MAGMICDNIMPDESKVKMYEIVVTPVMLHGSELWVSSENVAVDVRC